MRPAWRLGLVLGGALAAAPARAEYCIDYAAWHVRQFGRPNYCWPTKAACEDYYRSRCLNPTYARDCASACYPAPGTNAGGSPGAASPAPGAAAAAAAAAQLKLVKELEQQQAAEERAFQLGLKGFSTQLKGPPPAWAALGQLGGLAGGGEAAVKGLAGPPSATKEEQARVQAGWPGLKAAPPPTVKAPPPPSPSIEVEGATRGGVAVPQWLLDALSRSRRELATQEQEVLALERQVEAAEAQRPAAVAPASPVATKAPEGREDEALRRAREALARARANRDRTRAELERMEREAAAAPASPSGAGPERP